MENYNTKLVLLKVTITQIKFSTHFYNLRELNLAKALCELESGS